SVSNLFYKIDVKRSIKNRRVIYREDLLNKALDFVLYAMSVLFPMYAAVLFLVFDLRNPQVSLLSWLLLIGGLSLSLAIFRRILQISRLDEYVVRGDFRARMRDLVAKNKWIKVRDDKDIFVALLPGSWRS